MALKKSTKKLRLPEMGLNITSLMDVLTVLIFFLIRTMSVTSEVVNPPDGLRLPAQVSDAQVEEAVVVALSQKELRLNNDILMQLKNGRFTAGDIVDDGRTLGKLKSALQKEHSKKKQLFVSKAGGDFVPPGRILIQADKELPFETLKYLLHTAAVAGYSDFQFVVVPKE